MTLEEMNHWILQIDETRSLKEINHWMQQLTKIVEKWFNNEKNCYISNKNRKILYNKYWQEIVNVNNQYDRTKNSICAYVDCKKYSMGHGFCEEHQKLQPSRRRKME